MSFFGGSGDDLSRLWVEQRHSEGQRRGTPRGQRSAGVGGLCWWAKRVEALNTSTPLGLFGGLKGANANGAWIRIEGCSLFRGRAIRGLLQESRG